jgi:Secretion system C-terminal sorting domain
MKKLSSVLVLLVVIVSRSFAIAPITGISTLCSGDSTILHDADTGSWVSTNPAIASIDRITGMIHGVAGGTVTVLFTRYPDTARLTVTIIASPSLTSSLAPAAVCDSNIFNYTPMSAVSGTTFAWSRTAVPGIPLPAAMGSGNPMEMFANITSLPVLVTYVYTMSASGCANVQNVTVTVNPTPRLSSTLTPPDICDSAVFHYLPTSITPGTQYSWNRPMVSGILPATSFAGTGAGVISEALYNTTSSTISVNYIYRLSIGSCTNSFTQVVRVNVLKCSTLLEKPVGSSNDVYSIYPNPNNGSFRLAVNSAVQSGLVVITDMAGRVTERREFNNVPNANELFNLENVAPGNYLVVITLDGTVYREKVAIW